MALSQRGSQRISVTYGLTGGPAVVTVDFQTNGVSIRAERIGGKPVFDIVGDGTVVVEKPLESL